MSANSRDGERRERLNAAGLRIIDIGYFYQRPIDEGINTDEGTKTATKYNVFATDVRITETAAAKCRRL